jgi:hypothetical protein
MSAAPEIVTRAEQPYAAIRARRSSAAVMAQAHSSRAGLAAWSSRPNGLSHSLTYAHCQTRDRPALPSGGGNGRSALRSPVAHIAKTFSHDHPLITSAGTSATEPTTKIASYRSQPES